jgi:3D (Asp-Asp-Asp) domain-containing protein
MLQPLLWVSLLIFASCGKSPSTTSSNPIEVQDNNLDAPHDLNVKDIKKISTLLPTTYYVPQEKEVSCKGKYGGNVYDGSELSEIHELNGDLIANVCTRFFKTLLMEGTAILRDRGQGEVAINYSGAVKGDKRFHVLDRCSYGEGTKRDLCLLPFHTLAADNKAHQIGDIIYIPKANGLVLPDGSIHEGYFVVRDTGGAFNGIGARRVDMFTGTQPDNNNVFMKAGFDKKNPMAAYKIQGSSADIVKARLKHRFGELY